MSVIFKAKFKYNSGFFVYLVFILSFSLILLGVSYKSFDISNLYKVSNLAVDIDLSISKDLKLQIKDLVKSLPVNKLNAYSILEIVFLEGSVKNKLFKVIKSCSVRYKSSGKIYIKFDVYKPISVLNFLDKSKKSILTDTGILIDLKAFNNEILNIHKTIDVLSFDDADYKDLASLIEDINNMNYDILSKYNITWHNKHKVILKDYKSNFIVIIDKNLKRYLKKLFLAQELYGEKKYKIIDIRFKDQIVCSYDKGGII